MIKRKKETKWSHNKSKCAQLEEDLNVKEVMRIDEVERLNEQINQQAAAVIDETSLNQPSEHVMEEILDKNQHQEEFQ